MNIRKFGLWMLILIAVNLLATPISAQDTHHTVVYDNIRFSFPAALATGIHIEAIAANPLTLPKEQFSFEHYPEHIRFNFLNYLDGSEFFLPYVIAGPQILVYSTEAIREFGYDFSGRFDMLETLLRERPDLSTYAGASVLEFELQLPLLPWVNAAQMLRSHPQYIEVAGVGSGIRFITYYSQDADYITDQQLFYTFQAIMDSGTQYVSASFPVKTGLLPETVDMSAIDWKAFAANYSDVYLPETFALIDNLPDDAFTPSLDTLDALIQSITFETAMTAWQTYTDVEVGYSFQYPPDRQICALANSLELLLSPRYFDDPNIDHCASAYQANPISIIFSTEDDAFQAFRAENYPNSFVDYLEETPRIAGRDATRISGKEVESDLLFELFRFESSGSYLIFRALGEENISVLNQILTTLRFPISLRSHQ